MTKDEVIEKAARRLGDETTEFKTFIGGFFDDLLLDLAAEEVIEALRTKSTFDIIAAQREYNTRTMTGLAATEPPPIRVERIVVPTYGLGATLRRVDTDEEFEAMRFGLVDIAEGQPQIWRYYPNRLTVELWPPADADSAGVGIGEVTWQKSPTTLAGGANITEIHSEDIETIVYGLIARGAPFRDESLAQIDNATALYMRGRDRMWGRTHNDTGGRTNACDF